MTLDSQRTYPVTFITNELLFLSDQFSLLSPWPEWLDFDIPEFLRKIGRAYLDMNGSVSATPSEPIHLTLDELWMIREVAKSSAMVGADKVGINLLKKAFEGIFALEALGEQLTDFGNTIVSDEELPDYMRGFDFGLEENL